MEKDILTQEPKKVFINTILIHGVAQANNLIFVDRSSIKAIPVLKGIILSLQHSSKDEALKKQLQKLGDYEKNMNLVTEGSLEEIYSDIMDYLHNTYLRGYRPRVDQETFEQIEKEK